MRLSAAVRLWEQEGTVCFEVSDDGPGIDPNGKPGAGLTNMRDRVGAIGGSVEIGAANGSGTAVRGSIPVQPSAR